MDCQQKHNLKFMVSSRLRRSVKELDYFAIDVITKRSYIVIVSFGNDYIYPTKFQMFYT